MFEIFLILKLDDIVIFYKIFIAVLLLPLGALWGMRYADDIKSLEKPAIKLTVAWIVFVIMLVLTPNTKTALTMIAGESITNNKEIIKTVDKSVELLPKVIEAIDKYLDKKGE